MLSTNGHGPQRAILYTRVSGDKQRDHGYSLSDQKRKLTEWAAKEGYEVLEVVEDGAWSGGFLERPGLDRVRERVAIGGVDAVVTLFRDRLARGVYAGLLAEEFAEHGCRLIALNAQVDDSPEGELHGGMLDLIANWQRKKIAQLTQRGKLQKAREGKIVAAQRCPNYGFVFNESRDAYLVDPETMPVVRRIFEMVGVEGRGINYLVGVLERDGVSAPRGGRWNKTMVRNILVSDLYRPMSAEEAASLVAPEVAVLLDARKSYGIWWYNRRRTSMRQVAGDGPDGERLYKRKNDARPREPEEWVAVPVDHRS
jgi:site-specific DNA recombinase